jgi:hypothetical protein
MATHLSGTGYRSVTKATTCQLMFAIEELDDLRIPPPSPPHFGRSTSEPCLRWALRYKDARSMGVARGTPRRTRSTSPFANRRCNRVASHRVPSAGSLFCTIRVPDEAIPKHFKFWRVASLY